MHTGLSRPRRLQARLAMSGDTHWYDHENPGHSLCGRPVRLDDCVNEYVGATCRGCRAKDSSDD